MLLQKRPRKMGQSGGEGVTQVPISHIGQLRSHHMEAGVGERVTGMPGLQERGRG
jgi:hypothetical protein